MLKRTPLYEAQSPPARSSSTSPAGRCRCSTRGCGRAPRRSHRRAASSTSRTWARSRPPGPQALELLQRLLSNDVSRLEVGGAQYSVLCREDGGDPRRPLHLPARRRPLPDGHQRLQPRARLRLVPRARGGFRRRGRRRDRPLRDARRAGPRSARESWPLWLTASCRRGCAGGDRRAQRRPRPSSAAPATPARTGSRCCVEPEAAPALWDALLEGGVPRPRAWPPATPCGSRSASTSTATTYGRSRNPIEAGLGLVLQGGDGLHRLRGGRRRARGGTAEKLAPFMLTGPGIPRQGNARGAGRRGGGRR